jgi:hypothetical protein
LTVAAGYLLDTNVISETRKTRADSRVMGLPAQSQSPGVRKAPDAIAKSIIRCCLSVISIVIVLLSFKCPSR